MQLGPASEVEFSCERGRRRSRARVTTSITFCVFNLAPLLLHHYSSTFKFPLLLLYLYFSTFTLNVIGTLTIKQRLRITCCWDAKVKLSILVKEADAGHALKSKPPSLYTFTFVSLLFYLHFEHYQHQPPTTLQLLVLEPCQEWTLSKAALFAHRNGFLTRCKDQ